MRKAGSRVMFGLGAIIGVATVVLYAVSRDPFVFVIGLPFVAIEFGLGVWARLRGVV